MAKRRSTRTKRRGLVPLLIIVALAIAWRLFLADRLAPHPTNVVLISIDTCRADHLGCYGYAHATTPTIDRVAADGVRFARVHSTNPITLPAHCSMLTGTDPLVHGVHNNHSYHLGASNATLAELLGERGFATAAFVSAPVLAATFGLDQGFDRYDDAAGAGERRGERTSAAAIRWLEANTQSPFFLFLHYFDPHNPYAPPEPFASSHAGEPYDGEIAYTDHCIGQVLGALERLGLDDHTVLIITADHGESLGEHGEATHSFFIYDSALRVPLVIRAPGAARSTVVEQPVGIVDIVPTVLGLLRLPLPSPLSGRDLSPWVLGEGEPVERELYCESLVPTEYGCSALRGLIQGDWKFVWSVRPELYDLERDPDELQNRLDEEPQRAGAMQTRLQEMVAMGAGASGPDGARRPDAATLRRLRALGYAGGASTPPAGLAAPAGEDPKDFIAVLDDLLRANELRVEGQLDEAKRLCLKILETRPDNPRALQILGDVAFLGGDFEGAVSRYTRYLGVTDDPAATSGAATALRRDADLAEVHYNLGNSLHRLGQLDAAAEHYRQAIRNWDELAPAHNSLGAVLAQQGKLGEAIAQFRRAVALDPRSQSARDNLARAMAMSRGSEDAQPR